MIDCGMNKRELHALIGIDINTLAKLSKNQLVSYETFARNM